MSTNYTSLHNFSSNDTFYIADQSDTCNTMSKQSDFKNPMKNFFYRYPKKIHVSLQNLLNKNWTLFILSQHYQMTAFLQHQTVPQEHINGRYKRLLLIQKTDSFFLVSVVKWYWCSRLSLEWVNKYSRNHCFVSWFTYGSVTYISVSKTVAQNPLEGHSLVFSVLKMFLKFFSENLHKHPCLACKRKTAAAANPDGKSVLRAGMLTCDMR